MIKISGKILFYFFVSAVFIVVFVFVVNPTKGSQDKKIVFKIEPNQSALSVINDLYSQKIIGGRILFLIKVISSGSVSKFQPGSYSIELPISYNNLIKTISSGPTEVEVVIFPGMTVAEIDDLLSSLKIIKKGELIDFNPQKLKKDFAFLSDIKNLEGFLMPDTYHFFLDSEPKDVVAMMLSNFSKNTEKFLSGDNLYRTIKMASLIEKEVITQEDKILVSGVIKKRLEILLMPLQIDASVVYGKCNGRFIDCGPLLSSDFKVDNPYNLYMYKGLPPTPISNPSLSSIKAALSPKVTKYVYYLSDPATKKTIFSSTLEEHANNREKYLGL